MELSAASEWKPVKYDPVELTLPSDSQRLQPRVTYGEGDNREPAEILITESGLIMSALPLLQTSSEIVGILLFHL
jgi:hypothetical protein